MYFALDQVRLGNLSGDVKFVAFQCAIRCVSGVSRRHWVICVHRVAQTMRVIVRFEHKRHSEPAFCHSSLFRCSLLRFLVSIPVAHMFVFYMSFLHTAD